MPPPSAAPERLYTPGDALRAECDAAGRDAFVAAHPHAWLVQDLQVFAGAGDPPSSNTAVDMGLQAGPDPERLRRLYLAPHQFGFVPLLKSARNPWTGRLLVGRAPTNDVVLRHPSVSKVHARLLPQGEGWALGDAGSTNGTWLDGRLLEPDAPAVPLPSPCLVKVGSVVCLVLSSRQAFDALRPPTAR